MEKNIEIQQKVAAYLLQIKAIKLSPTTPFTWASGLKSPIYCDNRTTLSFPQVRNYIRDSFVTLINQKYPDVDGLKSGFVRAAGYNLIATAHRGNTRLIAVVMGAKTPNIRVRETRRLLDLGFQMTQGRASLPPENILQ